MGRDLVPIEESEALIQGPVSVPSHIHVCSPVIAENSFPNESNEILVQAPLVLFKGTLDVQGVLPPFPQRTRWEGSVPIVFRYFPESVLPNQTLANRL
jgi:hypothetical protein